MKIGSLVYNKLDKPYKMVCFALSNGNLVLKVASTNRPEAIEIKKNVSDIFDGKRKCGEKILPINYKRNTSYRKYILRGSKYNIVFNSAM